MTATFLNPRSTASLTLSASSMASCSNAPGMLSQWITPCFTKSATAWPSHMRQVGKKNLFSTCVSCKGTSYSGRSLSSLPLLPRVSSPFSPLPDIFLSFLSITFSPLLLRRQRGLQCFLCFQLLSLVYHRFQPSFISKRLQCGPQSNRTKSWNPYNAMLSTAAARQPTLTKTSVPTDVLITWPMKIWTRRKQNLSRDHRTTKFVALLTVTILTAFNLARVDNEILGKKSDIKNTRNLTKIRSNLTQIWQLWVIFGSSE